MRKVKVFRCNYLEKYSKYFSDLIQLARFRKAAKNNGIFEGRTANDWLILLEQAVKTRSGCSRPLSFDPSKYYNVKN
ncbi:hypothetical protein GCM10027566_15120 [Arachidicoccus ginsenosidivorans]|jgi:hypothetical protein